MCDGPAWARRSRPAGDLVGRESEQSFCYVDDQVRGLVQHELFERGRRLFADRAVLLISHRFSTVRWADRIYVLHDGAVVETGDHRSLVEAGGHYAQLFELQAAAYRPVNASDEPTEHR